MENDSRLKPPDAEQTREYARTMIIEIAKLLADAGDLEFAKQLTELVRSHGVMPRIKR